MNNTIQSSDSLKNRYSNRHAASEFKQKDSLNASKPHPFTKEKAAAYKTVEVEEIGHIKNDVVDNNMAILILNAVGLVQHCNNQSGRLLGWQSKSLLSQHVSTVFPQLTKTPLLKNNQVCSRVRFLARIGHQFDAIGQLGNHFKCELFFNHKEYQGQHYLQLIAHPIEQV